MSFADNFAGHSPSLLFAVVHHVDGSDVFVTLPSGIPDHVYGPCPTGAWASPGVDDECLVARDEMGGYWVVSW